MDICEATSLEREKINRHPWELARIEVVKSFLRPIISTSLVSRWLLMLKLFYD